MGAQVTILLFMLTILICTCYSHQKHHGNHTHGLNSSGFGKNVTTASQHNVTLVRHPTTIAKQQNQTTPKPSRNRIVGGIETEENEYPFIVSLSKYGKHFCGGSIINEEWIITAAHCVKDPDFEVTAGEHDLNKAGGNEQIVRAKKVTLHPSYNPVTFEDDIALVRVAPGFSFNKKVAQFNLPDVHFVATGNVTTAGWGVTAEGSNAVSPVLRKVTIPVFSNIECVKMYGNDFHQHKMICAGESGGGKDACQGDSGGPLLCDNHFKGATLCGIVSFGFGCARPEYAGVYTKVAYYADWITWEQNLDNNNGKYPWQKSTTKQTDAPVKARYTRRPREKKNKAPSIHFSMRVIFSVLLIVMLMFL